MSRNLVHKKVRNLDKSLPAQEDFISIISHEIKSPISAAIFQSKSIIEDIDTGNPSHTQIKKEVVLLNAQLTRTGNLLSKLFSVQYFDTHEVMLIKEKVDFAQFIEYEIEFFSHVHTNITFILSMNERIGIIRLDRVQFQQVITNLLENAIKHTDYEKPIIKISVQKVGKYLELIIEDNGKGFKGIEIKDIFDKYKTGNDGSLGLGMGLYLCKKIVTLHNGTIVASNSETYTGAKFTIQIPI